MTSTHRPTPQRAIDAPAIRINDTEVQACADAAAITMLRINKYVPAYAREFVGQILRDQFEHLAQLIKKRARYCAH